MSHDATNWAVKVRGIKPAAKVVLFHLADRHNKDTGRCDPSQERLAYDCEMSRASVNNHLNSLEQAGFLQRIQRVNPDTKRQERTSYILNFDVTEAQDIESRVQNLDMEAVSKNEADPCPKMSESRVQNLDTNPVREPGSKPVSNFDAFWSLWPHKVGKDKARVAFKRLSQQNRTDAIERLPSWLVGWRKEYPDATHIHASSYINGKRWEDDYGQAVPSQEMPLEALARYADAIIQQRQFMLTHIKPRTVEEIISRGLATTEQCERANVL